MANQSELVIENGFSWQAEVAKLLFHGRTVRIDIEDSPLKGRVLFPVANANSFTPARFSKEDELIGVWLSMFRKEKATLHVSFRECKSEYSVSKEKVKCLL